MAILDPTTQAEWLGAPSDDAKALTVVGALTEPVTVEIRNGSSTLMGSGDMTSPWASAVSGQVVVGEVDADAIVVDQAGTPDGSWRMIFKGANGRYVQASFGLPGSGAEMTWSLPAWSVGDKATLGTVSVGAVVGIDGDFTLTSSSMDSTTLAAYDAATTNAGRAQAIVAALAGTVSIEIFDGSNLMRASGTMQAPWASSSGLSITIGEVSNAGIVVNSGGTPDPNWYIQFRSGTRYVRAPFGVMGSSAAYRWSLPQFTTNMRGTIGTATMLATAATVTPTNRAPVWGTVPTITIQRGSSVSLPGMGLVSDPDGDTLTYSIDSTSPMTTAALAALGLTLSSAGVLTASAGATVGTTSGVIVRADDGRGAGSAPVNTALPSISGTPQVGVTLMVNAATWTSASSIQRAYQWLRGGSAIPGAIGTSYTPIVGDVGFTISVRETATNTDGSTDATSASVGPVVAASAPGALSTVFGLTSAAGGTDLPFTFGHAFKQGDVSSAQVALASGTGLTDWQCTPLTYWSDGSVRHAIIAGRITCTANVARSLSLTSGANPGGTALTEADLAASLPATTVTVGAHTLNLNSLVGTAARQRTVCSGPVMSNWIYRQAVAGSNHLVIWVDVRLYKGGAVEIFPWVENAYLSVASPASTAALACSVVMGGTTRFSQSIAFAHHTRIPLITGSTFSHWSGTDPQIVPKHDPAYLRSTKCVPNLAFTNPSAATLNGLPQTYTPNSLGGVQSPMSGAGGSGAILGWATLPGQALYVTTGDARAYRAALVLGFSGGSWSSHYRDQGTNEPPLFTSYPSLIPSDLPAATGATNGVEGSSGWATHQPSFAYLPWLITARWWFLDEQLFWSFQNYLVAHVSMRRGESSYLTGPWLYPNGSAGIMPPGGSNFTMRGAAWAIRTLAQAFASVPSSHSSYAALKASWEANVNYYKQVFVDGTHAGGGNVSPLGTLGNTSADGTSLYTGGNIAPGSTAWWTAGWMHGMQQQAWGHALELGLPQSVSSAAAHSSICSHALKFAAGLAGDGSAGSFNWRRFIVYAVPVTSVGSQPPTSNHYANFGQVLTEYQSGAGGLGSLSAAAGGSMKAHFSNTDFNALGTEFTYGSMQLAALAYAVDSGVAGAQAGYNRITGAYGGTPSSSWAAWAAQLSNDPVYAVAPRVVASTGLDFPSNDGSGNFFAFQFLSPQNNGLPLWGPSNAGVTYIWKIRPRQQSGYYTTFFWGPSGAFTANHYYGAHPYPNPPPGGSAHNWEVSIEGRDDQVTLAGSTKTVVKDVWYTQALRVIYNANGTKTLRFYTNLPSVANADVIQSIAQISYGTGSPPTASALTFGDAPWSRSNERLSGVLRGVKVFATALSEADMLAEAASDSIATVAGASSIWWKKINPTPDNLTCEAGTGRTPVWADTARKASLWVG